MNRRAFLRSIPQSIIWAGFLARKASAANKAGYDYRICSSLENELSKQTQRMGFERSLEQRNNLCIGFEEVQPASIIDLAFVVWCGEQGGAIADTAKEYRLRRGNKSCAKDYYPYISLEEMAVPESRGLYIFREEFAVLVQESLELLSRRDAANIAFEMYARPKTARVVVTHDNFKETFSDLISARSFEQVGIENMYKLFVFINGEYGKSLSFTYCATIADRACNA